MLTPEQSAAVAAEEAVRNDAMMNFNHEAYAYIIKITDQCFDTQWDFHWSQGDEDYVCIVSAVSQQWCSSGQVEVYMCHDHWLYGWDWFEVQVADRIDHLLRHNGDLGTRATSRAARLFSAHHRILTDELRKLYSVDEASSEETDVEAQEEPVPEQQDQEEQVHAEQVATPAGGEAAPIDPLSNRNPARRSARSSSRDDYTPPHHRSRFPSRDEHMTANDSDPDISELTRPLRRNRSSTRTRHRTAESRVHEPRCDRELRQYRQSHFQQERRRLERHYDIVTELNDVGRIRLLGNMEYRVKNKAGRAIGVVRNVHGYSLVGECAVFWRLKS
jgi:hypothetical protein